MIYVEEYFWIEQTEQIFLLGLTKQIKEIWGQILFLEYLQKKGNFCQGDTLLHLESNKMVWNMISPWNGNIIACNRTFENSPDLLTNSSEKDAWLFQILLNNSSDNIASSIEKYNAWKRTNR